jgi:hypothetical protein
VYILAQVGFRRTEAAPIFSGMNSVAVFFGEGNRDVPSRVNFSGGLFLVRTLAVGVANREIETVGCRELSF